jgi:hypothetical protein
MLLFFQLSDMGEQYLNTLLACMVLLLASAVAD